MKPPESRDFFGGEFYTIISMPYMVIGLFGFHLGWILEFVAFQGIGLFLLNCKI